MDQNESFKIKLSNLGKKLVIHRPETRSGMNEYWRALFETMNDMKYRKLNKMMFRVSNGLKVVKYFWFQYGPKFQYKPWLVLYCFVAWMDILWEKTLHCLLSVICRYQIE